MRCAASATNLLVSASSCSVARKLVSKSCAADALCPSAKLPSGSRKSLDSEWEPQSGGPPMSHLLQCTSEVLLRTGPVMWIRDRQWSRRLSRLLWSARLPPLPVRLNWLSLHRHPCWNQSSSTCRLLDCSAAGWYAWRSGAEASCGAFLVRNETATKPRVEG